MRVKLPFEDLNHNPCAPHPTSPCTCEVFITPRMHGSEFKIDTKMIIVNHLFQLFQSLRLTDKNLQLLVD